ncbi:hypothetical protein ABK040_004712 [Willaertia magna]
MSTPISLKICFLLLLSFLTTTTTTSVITVPTIGIELGNNNGRIAVYKNGTVSVIVTIPSPNMFKTKTITKTIQKLIDKAEEMLGEKVYEAVIAVPRNCKDIKTAIEAIEATSLKFSIIVKFIAQLYYFEDLKVEENISSHDELSILIFELKRNSFRVNVASRVNEISVDLHELTKKGHDECSLALHSFEAIPGSCCKHYYVENEFEEKHLGGKDIDEIILNYLIEEFIKRWPDFETEIEKDSEAKKLLRVEAEKVKINLSFSSEVTVNFQFRGIDFSIVVTRNIFETLTQDLFKKIRNTLDNLKQHLKTEFSPPRKTFVLLTGKGSQIPIFQQTIKDYFKEMNVTFLIGSTEATVKGATIASESYRQQRLNWKLQLEEERALEKSLGELYSCLEELLIELRESFEFFKFPKEKMLVEEETKKFSSWLTESYYPFENLEELEKRKKEFNEVVFSLLGIKPCKLCLK